MNFKKIKFYFEGFLISLLGLIPFIPNFKNLDLIGPQFYFISIIQLLISIYLLVLSFKESTYTFVSKGFISPIIFLIIGLFSFFISFNVTESTIEFSRYFLIFISLFNLTQLVNHEKKYIKFVLALLLVLLTIESFYIFKIFIENYTYENGLSRIRELQGFSSNQNVGAFSLIIKLPILVYFIFKSNKKLYETFLIIVFSITVFDLLIIGSRGAILSLYFLLFIFSFCLLLKHPFSLKFSKKYKAVIFKLVSLFVLISVIQTVLYKNSSDLQVVNRSLNSYSNVDESFAKRSRYYLQAISAIVDKPLTGYGIGNWKIFSIKYDKDNIDQYQVPYHAHNDFLQIGAELGIFGLIFYLLIFFYPLFQIIKSLRKKRDLDFIFHFMLVSSLLIYLFDANINFPRARPYSQMNILFILSILYTNLPSLKIKYFIRRLIYSIIIVTLVPTLFISKKIFKALQEQVFVYTDFNQNRDNLLVPIEIAYNYEDKFPNITNTTIPIVQAKANYFAQNGNYKKAIELNKIGNIYNPFLGIGEFQNASIFEKLKQFDSAIYYAKIAHEKLPRNIAHISRYQKLLALTKNIKEEKKLFEKVKHIKSDLIWKNHAVMLSNLKQNDSFKFDKIDKEFAEKAIELYPDEEWIKIAYKLIGTGFSNTVKADEYDILANRKFNEGNYGQAVLYWEKAIKFLKNEEAYYLNIIQSYIQMKEFEKALKVIERTEKINVKSNDGKFEFLNAVVLNGLGKNKKACELAIKSAKKGFEKSKNLAKLICKNSL